MDNGLPELDMSVDQRHGEEVESRFRMVGTEQQKSRVVVWTELKVDGEFLEGAAKDGESHVSGPRKFRILNDDVYTRKNTRNVLSGEGDPVLVC